MHGVFLDATFHGSSNDTVGGRGWLRRPEISPIYPLQLSTILGSSPPPWRLVLVMAINCSLVSTTPAITENPWQRFFTGVVDTAEGGHWFMNKTWSRKPRVRLPLKLQYTRICPVLQSGSGLLMNPDPGPEPVFFSPKSKCEEIQNKIYCL